MATVDGTKKRALLVEDDEDNSELMTLELKILGYEVSVASNGVDAVELATSSPPDVIIMDMLLPRMSGFEAVLHIRSNPTTQGIPILAMTALARDKDRDRCLASGCNDHLAKPFTPSQFKARIGRLLPAG
jgi:CheY-like chemotaxis protein